MNEAENYAESIKRLFENVEVMLHRKPKLFEVPLLFFAYSQGRLDEAKWSKENAA